MKKSAFILILLALFITLFPLTALAHPGKTDSSGGHTDSSTGEYHYHHGYPAHKHPGGVCPYDNKIGNTSGSTGDGVWDGGSWRDDSNDYTGLIVVAIVLSVIFVISYFALDLKDYLYNEPESYFDYLFKYKYDGIAYRVVKSVFFLPNVVFACSYILASGGIGLFMKTASGLFGFAEDNNVIVKLFLIPISGIFALFGIVVGIFYMPVYICSILQESIVSFFESIECVGEEIRDVDNMPSVTAPRKEEPTNPKNPPVETEQKALDTKIEEDAEEKIESYNPNWTKGQWSQVFGEMRKFRKEYKDVLCSDQWAYFEGEFLCVLSSIRRKIDVKEEPEENVRPVDPVECRFFIMDTLCNMIIARFVIGKHKTIDQNSEVQLTTWGKKYRDLYFIMIDRMLSENSITHEEYSAREGKIQKVIVSLSNELDANELKSEPVVEVEKEPNADENSQTPTILPNTIPMDWENRFTIEFENVLREKKELLQAEQYKILERDFFKTLSSLDKHVTAEEFLHYLDVVDYKMYVMNTVCDLILKYFNAGRYKKTSPNSPVELTSHGKGYSKLYINLIDDMLAFRFLTQFGYDERTKDLQRAIDNHP